MKTITLILLAFGMNAQKWTDYDKHYMVSVNISSYVGSSTYYLTKRPLLSALTGLGASFLVGLGKELVYDGMLRKGVKSEADLDADLRGSLAGSFFSFGITNTVDKKRDKLDSLKYIFNARETK